MKDSLLRELADTWELQAATDKTAGNEAGRMTLRACADTIRMMLDSPVVRLHQEPDAAQKDATMRRALRFIAKTQNSDWPARCQALVQTARDALSEIEDEGGQL